MYRNSAIEPMFSPDIITPQTPIRLPGVPGEVLWQATLSANEGRLKSLDILMPNGTLDTLTFDVNGVSVSRTIDDMPVRMTPSMTRQTLTHARIIAGLHLQVAIEKVNRHGV